MTQLFLDDGETRLRYYFWREPWERFERQKLFAYTYFKSWNWVITASVYVDEFFEDTSAARASVGELLTLQIPPPLSSVSLPVIVQSLSSTLLLLSRNTAPPDQSARLPVITQFFITGLLPSQYIAPPNSSDALWKGSRIICLAYFVSDIFIPFHISPGY